MGFTDRSHLIILRKFRGITFLTIAQIQQLHDRPATGKTRN